MFGFLKDHRRRQLRSQPFPPAWEQIIQRNFPLYLRLPTADRAELRGDIQVFLAEKNFEGCGGLTLTDEIRVTIAAQACLLLLHRRNEDYPGLDSILVYPSAYVAKAVRNLPDGVVSEELSARLGEAWTSGAVVLSWDDVRQGAADIHDGHNVVLHEFAHALDGESGSVEGAPKLGSPSMYVAWARVLGAAYEKLRQDVTLGRPTVLSSYGATNPAEFFAVATENFFERPSQLKRSDPDLYQELKLFYQQDPLGYHTGQPESGR